MENDQVVMYTGSEVEADVEYEVEEIWDGNQWRMVHKAPPTGKRVLKLNLKFTKLLWYFICLRSFTLMHLQIGCIHI